MVNSEMKHKPHGENNAGSDKKSSALSVCYDYTRGNLRDLCHDNEDFISCISFTIASIVTNNRDFNRLLLRTPLDGCFLSMSLCFHIFFGDS